MALSPRKQLARPRDGLFLSLAAPAPRHQRKCAYGRVRRVFALHEEANTLGHGHVLQGSG